ncbi:MAG: ATP-binding protein [Limisphaerales bacterium]
MPSQIPNAESATPPEPSSTRARGWRTDGEDSRPSPTGATSPSASIASSSDPKANGTGNGSGNGSGGAASAQHSGSGGAREQDRRKEPSAQARSAGDWEFLVRRLEPVLERMPVGCVLMDVDSRIVAMNRVALELFGRDLGGILGRTPGGALVPNAAWEHFQSIFRQVGPAGLSTSAVLEHDDPRGNRVICEWRVTALTRPDGNVAGYTAKVSPQGSSGTAQPSDPVAETGWDWMFDRTPVPSLLVTPEGRVWRANPGAQALLGNANGENLTGRSLSDLLACPSESGAQSPCGSAGNAPCGDCGLGSVLKAASGQGIPVERREIRRSLRGRAGGGDAWFLVSTSAVRHQGQALVLVSLEDVTDRRRNEQRLREQAAFLAAADAAICRVDSAGCIRLWNAGAERLYGWPMSEAVGRPVSEVMFGGTGYVWAGLRGMVLEKGVWEGDLEPFTKNKEVLSVRARAWLELNGDSDPTESADPGSAGNSSASVVLVATDWTERRRLERQLMRAQRLECVGTLACGIAHDLSNVLTPVQMAAELLRPVVTGTDSERFLNLLMRSATRGGEITRQLLLFGRGIESAHAPVDLKNLLKETVKILTGVFPKSIQVRGVIPDQLWPVVGDVTQIHQVLLNLCVNARDAMPDGGVLLVRAQNRELDPDSTRESGRAPGGKFVVLSVRDTGVGIREEIRAKIFDPFFTTKPPGQGSGLGLSTVQRIAQAHGGSVEVTSEVGRGTVFEVRLPVSEAPSAVPASPTGLATPTVPSSTTEGRVPRVLVIEDEPAIRDLMRSGLEAAGYNVTTAIDGAEGISIFARERDSFAVVVLEMSLPLVDGVTVIRTLRGLTPGLPIVVLGEPPSPDSIPPKTPGRSLTFVPKPAGIETLVEAVGAAMVSASSVAAP